jgi:hypothetical protein
MGNWLLNKRLLHNRFIHLTYQLKTQPNGEGQK